MRGFISSRNPCLLRKNHLKLVGADWEIVNETKSKGDAWIRQRAKPLLT
jgi:hypothetical protein